MPSSSGSFQPRDPIVCPALQADSLLLSHWGNEVSQSCLTLGDTMDCSLPGSSIHGILQAKVLEWGVIAFSEWILSYT